MNQTLEITGDVFHTGCQFSADPILFIGASISLPLVEMTKG
ncbi:hypothetical protein [Gimibacter soli]|uniref:Uncharacterized protein n=1 Tax=Gimibacter soli TaxID=3024400 RepID=A0AAE9XPN3_9PROT|nr:hypothetical protein [Gimibacter soli]WCL53947.1 hypothetical protein PH603_15525 [Gimibacter soli]